MPKRYWYIILTYVIMQLSGLVVGISLLFLLPQYYVEGSIYWSVFSFILALIIILRLLKTDMQMNLNRNDASTTGQIILWSILGVFLAFFVQGLATTIEINILGVDPGSENTQGIMEISRAFPIFIIIPAIIAPILEEIVFRKIIFGSLYKRMNFFFAALLSAFIFGVIHEGLEHLLVYASMGFVFAFLYVKTKSILTPIIVHAAMNTIAVIAQLSMTPEEIQKQLDQLQVIILSLL